MRTRGGVRRIGYAAIAGAFGFLVAACTASSHNIATVDGMGSANPSFVTHATAPSVPFDKLVMRISWPKGQDGTERSLFAYGPSAKNPKQDYGSQFIWWSVDLTKVAAVDVAINGKRVNNPRDVKQAHTAIYRLGGQSIPGYKGVEGYFEWTIWPAGDFTFDFTVYDDAGNVIGTMSHTITVAPMPANA
jgi:hypothetical protein